MGPFRLFLPISLAMVCIACSTPPEAARLTPPPETQKRLQSLVFSLPTTDIERQWVEAGRFGDGIHQWWMDTLKRENIKTAEVVVDVIWFFGPRRMRPVRVLYFTDYGERFQVADDATLERLRSSEVDDALKQTALRYAPQGHWIDLPHSIFRLFPAATSVTLFDYEWLPIPPHLFGGD